MIYKLTFMNEEIDAFKRVFEADPDATFLDLHKALLASVGYTDDQMTAFYLCNADWEREQEITLVPMPDTDAYDNMTMEATRLSDLLTEPKQRLIYVFDPMMDRYFFGTPNNSSITFLYDHMDTDTLNAVCQANELTQAEYFQAYMAYMEQMLVYYGYTLSDMTISGPFYISYHDAYVTPGRPFTLMAQAYTSGVFNSDFVSVQFNIPQENGAPVVKKGRFNKQQMLKKAKKINSFIGGKNTYQKR